MKPVWEKEFILESSVAGNRLDHYLLTVISLTRSRLHRLLQEGNILLNGKIVKAGYRLKGGERVSLSIPEPVEGSVEPEDISLDIVYEDQDLAVINKPAGLVVHPGSGHGRHTMVNALLFHCRDLSGIGGELRPGIVHRLDKDTSGIVVVAKHDAAHLALSEQFARREIRKIYYALVSGRKIAAAGIIDKPVGRHPVHRQKMAVRPEQGREAVTRYRILQRFGSLAFLEVKPKTGRTHQIRVHLAYIGCPIMGDQVYRGRSQITLGTESVMFHRQALHAGKLAFTHPSTGERVEFDAPLPADMQTVLDLMEKKRCLK
ncbi:MAG: RluA family pseudouridine synthase [bacterium]